jgi:hypothetical protein
MLVLGRGCTCPHNPRFSPTLQVRQASNSSDHTASTFRYQDDYLGVFKCSCYLGIHLQLRRARTDNIHEVAPASHRCGFVYSILIGNIFLTKGEPPAAWLFLMNVKLPSLDDFVSTMADRFTVCSRHEIHLD